MSLALPEAALRCRPVVLCVMDGVGLGPGDAFDAVASARTPNLDRLMRDCPWTRLKAHGTAVGLPSDADMGNSEVGHNALGAGRIFDQGAKRVDEALAGPAFAGETWKWLCGGNTLHLLGLLSDGNVHSHVAHVEAVVRRAALDGVPRVRVHVLTDGRDVPARSALGYLDRLESALAATGRDYRIASGGGRMHITMDRYEADWEMVRRGWDCHVHGVGRPFASAAEAIRTLYAEDPRVDDQWLGAFVIPMVDGRIRDGDAVLLFNFRGDRAIEISRAFEGREVPFDRGRAPNVRFAGMMQYDGDTALPARFLVDPPAIDRTVGQFLAANGRTTFAISETQKFGHVTYFFNGNRSGLVDPRLERYEEVPSDRVPFDRAPAMKAHEIADRVLAELRSWDHLRLNLANGDMVGHTGNLAAAIRAVEVVDACVGRIAEGIGAAGGVLLLTADHGNADDMVQRDRAGAPILSDGGPVPKTSHTLSPVPFVVYDPLDRWRLAEVPDPGLGNVGATVLRACGLVPSPDYLPSLIQERP